MIAAMALVAGGERSLAQDSEAMPKRFIEPQLIAARSLATTTYSNP